MVRLLIDRALETAYITAGFVSLDSNEFDISVRQKLTSADVGAGDWALIPTSEIALLTETHQVDPRFGVLTSESGAIAMRAPMRPDEIEEASILLYEVPGTAELLARATIWPFYGIRGTAWSTVAHGSSSITIVDGIAALEPAEAGFSEDLVRAWYILTEQPVVTHLLVVPTDASDDTVSIARTLLTEAAAAGYVNRRDVRKELQSESSVEAERLVEFLGKIRYELDPVARTAAYSLIARGSGGTRYPLLREIPWRVLPE